jgi:4-hydroxy-tetrahydrodipicolinate synthase
VTGTNEEAPIFEGVGVALVTLFDPERRVDTAATAAHAARVVEAGVGAVVVAGSTGEAATLSPEERSALIAAVRRAVPAGTPVLAGTGAPSAYQAAALTADAVKAGAEAVLALSPPGSRDLTSYYKEVAAAAGDRPVLAYHFPAMSSPGIPVAELAGLPVQGVKDSSEDSSRLLAELTGYRGWVYVGSAAMAPAATTLGAAGAILALANAEPELCVAAFAGDGDAWSRLVPAHLRMTGALIGAIKQMTAEKYGTPTTARMA